MSFRSLVKKLIPSGLFDEIEPYGHLAEAFIRHALAGFPGRGLKIIGVTGTNGKTSTAFMIHRMLTESGFKTGLMTTVAYGVDDDIKNQVQHYTNVPVPEFIRRLKWMRTQKIDWLVLEVTSQGLAQHRVYGVPFSVGVLTNITHEHLDYHKTFKRYVEAKRLLFKRVARNRKGLRTGIANADDPNGEYFAKTTPHPVLYGLEKGDVRAKNLKLSPAGSDFTAAASDAVYQIHCNIPGGFYVQNTLAAVCVGRALGLSKQQIEQGIAALKGVEGRMTTIDEGQDFDVIVDYAHTPDSFEKLFKDMKPLTKGKLIVMFGSAGRRDEAKRATQGELAGKYADEVVLTEEDDRDIDGLQILNEIAAGAKKAGKVQGKDLFLMLDRPEGINFTLKRAKKGDTVLLLGKGHEKTIERADGEHPWDEITTTHATLRKLR
ncbi:MAG TPA: UDP-N-acetylmuramyl-tripeptide synthetase [Candidatus Saccharimonadales bacterium]|jgi:UDP-N-acetylmuramoyl-L-alanyl-D-glutamate--2,6-diaminopimelate ligase|nr:UDP-N-acetylmuramyl-tripeptide synthetase [Candidatus Saccharimonadales bacterium]